MTANSRTAEHKSFNAPDETRPFEKGRVELLNIGGATIGRLTLEPGWRWSQHVKPIAGTEWCEAPHFQYQVSGRLHVQMADMFQIQTPAHTIHKIRIRNRSCRSSHSTGHSRS